MPNSAYEVINPGVNRSRVVFASPHSGRDYPWAFLRSSVLDEHAIRSSEDAFVDQLFDCAPKFGATFIKAGAPRSFVDLNRACDELDPALIEGVRRQGHNPRIASGLGVIPRVVANGRAIYRGKLTRSEAQRRIDEYWQPYHRKLQELLDHAHQRHGQAVLIDCHSMPHEAMDGLVRAGMKRPQVVLGDRFGASASGDVVDRVEAAFAGAGFVVTRNTPFAGAYITQAYGRPARSQHAVQVEIDRALYMDEAQVRPHDGFEDMQAALRQVVAEVAQIGQGRVPLAAE
jgi:N-formylglutamate deformylase